MFPCRNHDCMHDGHTPACKLQLPSQATKSHRLSVCVRTVCVRMDSNDCAWARASPRTISAIAVSLSYFMLRLRSRSCWSWGLPACTTLDSIGSSHARAHAAMLSYISAMTSTWVAPCCECCSKVSGVKLVLSAARVVSRLVDFG